MPCTQCEPLIKQALLVASPAGRRGRGAHQPGGAFAQRRHGGGGSLLQPGLPAAGGGSGAGGPRHAHPGRHAQPHGAGGQRCACALRQSNGCCSWTSLVVPRIFVGYCFELARQLKAYVAIVRHGVLAQRCNFESRRRFVPRPQALPGGSLAPVAPGLREVVNELESLVPGEACALVGLPNTTPLSGELGSRMRDELYTEIFQPPQRFVAVTTAGVLMLEKRRPVDVLQVRLARGLGGL